MQSLTQFHFLILLNWVIKFIVWSTSVNSLIYTSRKFLLDDFAVIHNLGINFRSSMFECEFLYFRDSMIATFSMNFHKLKFPYFGVAFSRLPLGKSFSHDF